METLQCDIAIIGGGAGGLTVAAVASQLGLKVVLAEGKHMGGDCLNAGCVPSKAFIAAANKIYQQRNASEFGIEIENIRCDFAKVMNHVHRVIEEISHHDSVERFSELGVKVISQFASFIDKQTFIAGDYTIKARHIVVATGSSPAIPPISGLENIAYLTNETIFSLTTQPDHLIIIGAGPIGCELGQAFHLLGSRVILLEAFTMMPRDEPELVQMLRSNLINQGIDLQEQCKIVSIKSENQQIIVEIEVNGAKKIIQGSHLLVAAGRKANVTALNLENAGVTYTPKGINVNARLQTTNKKIYAIGDVVGPYQFTHIASYHASIVIKNIIFKLPSTVNYQPIPWVTYTLPPLAHAGITTHEIDSQKIKIISVDYNENDRAVAEHETQGKIMVICDLKGKILGVSIFGYRADDMISLWQPFINKKLKTVSEMIIPYPTLSELTKKVSSEFYKPLLFSAFTRRIVKILGMTVLRTRG